MRTGYLVLLILFLACLAIRTTYELLKKHGRVNPKSTALFMFILEVMIVLWVSWFLMCPKDPLHIALPGIVRWAGFGAFVLGWILGLGALIQLRGVENIDHLVTTGLFAKLRHPMYTGFILWIFGWAIFHGAPLSLLAGLIAVGNILYWRSLEENHLEASYGEKYLEYRRRTWC